MHLNKCFAAAVALATTPIAGGDATATNHSADDLHECFSGWLLKTTTNFYGSEDLVLQWWFGALCFSFSVGGIVMLAVKPKWTKDSRFPYVTFAFLLMFLQGPLSFMADYKNMANDSIWHAYDRFMATPLLMLELSKIATMYPHVRTGTFTAYSLACCLAIFSFLNSQIAQSNHDTDGFVFWHSMWHVYPLACSAIMSFDLFVLGEYDAAAIDSSARAPLSGETSSKGAFSKDSPKPRLLSSVVMEHTAIPPASPARGVGNLRAR